MLAHILAIAVALGSFVLFMAAFFFPEVHRKYDFLWSGVAMFYALVLWICAGRITGGVLLGQTASVALLGWLGWEAFSLRRATTADGEKTVISPETQAKINRLSPNILFAPITNRFRKPKPPTSAPVESVATLVEEAEDPQTDKLESLADRIAPPSPKVEETTSDSVSASETNPEAEAQATAESITPPPQTPLEDNPDGEESETIEVATLSVEQSVDLETGEVLSESVEILLETIEMETEENPSVSEGESSASFIPLEKEETQAEKDEAAREQEPLASVEDERADWEKEESAIDLDTENSQPMPPQPPTPEMVEAAQEIKKHGNPETPVREFAPEVDLAPYAEPPNE
ncbi:Ycf66 family protein [Oscillatoria sp. FACHB-1406]|uniref:Ycf66 family protein n=1 Tax=Oscillatoria sp. FACHB-1406 TaxID=2692846 RepID=UPI001683C4FB|nr:Ycf66 family protein [Oscillatoria sp. FACHB-1406]MBD2579430.1 hypothetical protein [Oscillatoria sp. FACHB-1406]